MKTKTKVALGVGFLSLLIIFLAGAGIYSIYRLSTEAGKVIKDNQVSMDYMMKMESYVAGLSSKDTLASNEASDSLQKYLLLEAGNITEPGENAAVQQLRIAIHKLSVTGGNYTEVSALLNHIYRLNRDAILRKNNRTDRTADRAITYLSIIGTVSILLTFTLLLNFPGYVANPIKELSDRIRAIADRNFDQHLENEYSGEFGDLTNSFNYMARRLREYEKTNLAELTAEKKRIESIVNNLDDGIILVDANQRVIVANPKALQLLGMSAEDLVGQSVLKAAARNDLLREIAKGLTQNTPADKAPIRITVNGEESFFQRYVHHVYSYDDWKEQNYLAGSVIFLKNITEFKKLDLAKTQFIATVSHELKTPLSSINLSVKLLENARLGQLKPEQLQLVDTIRHESNRLLQYVNELLDFSQLESGNIRLNVASVNAGDIVNYALEAMRPTLESKKLQVGFQGSDEAMAVRADPEKTTWVVINLLGNAARYSPEGSTITVGIEHQPGRVLFSVRDQGPGIDPKYHEKIFERFVQVYQNGNKGGTGLGLAIAKDFIEAQGGQIWVESALGEGSTFKFVLPEA